MATLSNHTPVVLVKSQHKIDRTKEGVICSTILFTDMTTSKQQQIEKLIL